MPELPEVETVKRGLEKTIIGKVVTDFESDWHKAVNHPIKFYRAKLQGARVKKIRRRAKMLIIEFDNGWNILVHLKMTGQLVTSGPNKYTHAIFSFDDNSKLFFNDIRKFGWVRIFEDKDLEEELRKMGMGPEPLGKEFSLEYLRKRIRNRNRIRIKQFLMDNSNLVGVGNIYSDEVCFFAGVDPKRKVGTLTDLQVKKIHHGIQNILKAAIKAQGTTFSNYVNAEGEAGAYTKKLMVYQRYGQKCKVCRATIKREKIGGRTSSYCPHCQK